MALSSVTSSKDQDFGVSYIDVAESEKRLVRVTTNTYKTTASTYINIKLFKRKDDQSDFRLQQRVGLTVKEFQDLVANVENISVGPTTMEMSNEIKNVKRDGQCGKKGTEAKKAKVARVED